MLQMHLPSLRAFTHTHTYIYVLIYKNIKIVTMKNYLFILFERFKTIKRLFMDILKTACN